jgi:hypothetical protein
VVVSQGSKQKASSCPFGTRETLCDGGRGGLGSGLERSKRLWLRRLNCPGSVHDS